MEPGVDLAELAPEVVDRLRSQWETARSPTTVRTAGAAPRGAWDRLRIEQVISNLLSNAIKYGAGSPIEIVVSVAGDVARLEVHDHGVGISADDQARLFNRFERVGSIKSFGGLGLGLYVARQIVSAHHGTIRVESEPSVGTTFVVELPRAAD
jgi:signal transduction histidine kinase